MVTGWMNLGTTTKLLESHDSGTPNHEPATSGQVLGRCVNWQGLRTRAVFQDEGRPIELLRRKGSF